MLDAFYANIGSKLKTLAKCTFVVEALVSVITGIFLAISEDGLYFFIAVIGPIFAWISSWTLYAFGELVEKTQKNETHTKTIAEYCRLVSEAKPAHEPAPKAEAPALTIDPKTAPETVPQKDHPNKMNVKVNPKEINGYTVICPQCKREQPRNRKVCWYCGVNFSES